MLPVTQKMVQLHWDKNYFKLCNRYISKSHVVTCIVDRVTAQCWKLLIDSFFSWKDFISLNESKGILRNIRMKGKWDSI